MAKMRIMVVGAAPAPNVAAPVSELEVITIAAEGDAAKKAGRATLLDMGYTVRSMNWSPTADGRVELLAYATKGA